MDKAFEIDAIRQIIEQTLYEEHINNSYFVGGKNQLALTSFYEQLLSDSEVNRYVEVVRDLTNQQNRMGLIANGIILAPSNPTITNLNQSTIVPLEFTINFRCTLENRDLLKASLDNIVYILKGRKQDLCEFDNGKLLKVGTLGNNTEGDPQIRNGDFIGVFDSTLINDSTYGIPKKISDLETLGFETYVNQANNYLYFEDSLDHKLKVAVLTYDNETYTWVEQEESPSYPTIVFPPEHNSFTKWKVTMAFDSFRLSEPRTLNSKDLCELSFGGSATLVSKNVMVGNELTKMYIKKVGYKDSSGLVANSDTTKYWLEPLEMPSGNGASTIGNQLMSNKFISNSHTDGITLSRQYTFVYDYSIPLLKQLFYYARYGIQTYITPNLIYEVGEMFSAWGEVDMIPSKTRIVDDIEIENNENDVITIALPMQLQGDND